jgi:hypothetical protein
MMNQVRKRYIWPLLLAGMMCACSPGGESPNPPNTNTTGQAQPAPQAPRPPVAEQPVAAPAPAASAPAASVPAPAAAPAPPANAPKLFVPVTRIDFGKQPKDKTITRTITVKNVGKSELKIESVVPS